MSTVARRFCCTPSRLSSATWKAISELVCRSDSGAAAEFAKVSGIASSLINDKLFAENPMVVKNKGPRLRIYCLYGEVAISGEDKNEELLSWSPTAEDWQAFLPCGEEEFDETMTALAAKSAKFTAYNIKMGIPDDDRSSAKDARPLRPTIDWEAFEKL